MPLKATIFEKFSFTISKEFYPLPPIINFGGSPQISGKSLLQAEDH
jgi:hypothetical protein